MSPSYVVDFTTAGGTPMRMVVLAPGEFTNEHRASGEWTVEFFDRRYAHTELGQFTGGAYYLRTLAAHDDWHGLRVHGGEPAWDIDAETFAPLLALLRAVSS